MTILELSKYKNIFGKGYVPKYPKEVTKNVKNTVPCLYVISDFNDDQIFGTFYEKDL